MKAELLLDERHVIAEDAFVELVVWRLPNPVRGSAHPFKYRLALVAAGECVVRYDNEAGKGDHRHVDGVETPYAFSGYSMLLSDFWTEVERWIEPK
jgi:uncharacterized protein DUF6516